MDDGGIFDMPPVVGKGCLRRGQDGIAQMFPKIL